MPIYEYQCKSCCLDFEILHRSFIDHSDTQCPDCNTYDVEKKISLSSFKMTGKSSPSSEKFSDSSDIGRNVEEKFRTHGVEMPESVRKTIDDARGGQPPKGLVL